MNKINAQENHRGDNRERPIQNFPDYLKYVAKKSKAGFGKVHEELYRLYSDSFSGKDKYVQEPSTDKDVVTSEDNEPAKSKIGLRKRWSTAALLWSSAGQEKKLVSRTFVSYIPEEKDTLESSGSSKSDFEMLSEELDMLKRENKVLHNNGIFSASVLDKDKNMFDFDSVRCSMPHSELTEEAIYTNDRVLRVETFTDDTNNNNEDSSNIYSVPNLTHNQNQDFEIDDYVNLRTFCHADTIDEKEGEFESMKDITEADNQKPIAKNVVDVNLHETTKRLPLLKIKNDTLNKNVDDEDNYYLPPSQWKQSCQLPLEDEKFHKKSTTIAKHDKEKSKGVVKTGLEKDEEDEYVPPSKLEDNDYETVPSKIEAIPFYENIKNKRYFEEGENAYDHPIEWMQTGDMEKDAIVCSIKESNEDLYTKIIKSELKKSPESEYSVPSQCSNINMYDASCLNEMSFEGDYSVPSWPKPMEAKNQAAPNEKSNEGDYSIPRWTKPKQVESDAMSKVIYTVGDYDIPRSPKPVKRGNKTASKSNSKEGDYSVPRSQKLLKGDFKTSSSSNSTEGKYSVHMSQKPVKRDNNTKSKSNSTEGDYSVPRSQKIVKTGFKTSSSSNSTEGEYSVPISPNQVKGNNNTASCSNSTEDDYSVPRSQKPLNGGYNTASSSNPTEGDYSGPRLPKQVKGNNNIASSGNTAESDYNVPMLPKQVKIGYDTVFHVNSTEGDYSVPKWPKLVKMKNITTTNENSVGDHNITNLYKAVKDDIKPVSNTKTTNNTKSSSSANPLPYSGPPNSHVKITEKLNGDDKFSDENCTAEFFNYTVDEVVDCFNSCALTKLANLCKQKQLNGDHFRNLTADDLKGEPYFMNWFYLSKLFKVINGWRPQGSFKK